SHCREPVLLDLSYSDSCGLVASASLYGGQEDCHKAGALSDSSDPRLEGAQFTADFYDDGTVAYVLDFHGACQGRATGTGRVVNYSDADWFAEGALTGSSSCCENLQANIGIQ